MSDLNIFIILLNTAYLIWLTAFVAKDILWLRVLTVTGNLVVIPYYLYPVSYTHLTLPTKA